MASLTRNEKSTRRRTSNLQPHTSHGRNSVISFKVCFRLFCPAEQGASAAGRFAIFLSPLELSTVWPESTLTIGLPRVSMATGSNRYGCIVQLCYYPAVESFLGYQDMSLLQPSRQREERERLPGCRNSNRPFPAISGPPLTNVCSRGYPKQTTVRPFFNTPHHPRTRATLCKVGNLIHMIHHPDSSVNRDHSLASVNTRNGDKCASSDLQSQLDPCAWMWSFPHTSL
ncbi:hypothetical protein BKA83DRAFT_2691684 [Pisolithus microcarpus]|nr:hypothetical protein BKA83DRAFT_2691684 [Pisolithus microcarpus]